MRLLVTKPTFETYGAAIQAVSADVELVLWDEGVLRTLDGSPLPGGADGFELAWASHDLFVGTGYVAYFAALSAASNLEWFQSPGAGTDSPFFTGLLERGVRLSTSHVTSIPIAEFVLRSVLDVFQQSNRWVDVRAARRWDHHVMREVYGTTWLVIGVGAIGSDVASRARAFGATVIGSRRHPTGDEPVDEMVAPADVLGVVGRCDVVVVAAPATPETRHLVDAAFLEAMKPRSVLVNVARGSLVDQDALLAALARGRPETAILDAVTPEPPPADSPLWDHPQVVLTPHNSFAGDGCNLRNYELFLENLRRFLAGETLLNEQSLATA
jgi:phosphoglycerate dehydrogenase-like enzyme